MRKNRKLINKLVSLIVFLLIAFLLVSFNSFSAERDLNKEQKLGKKLSEDIEKKYEVIEDLNQNSLITEIGNKLARASDLHGMSYHFKILKMDGPNAFSIPGGYVYVTYDLFDYVQSDDELAGILAHEIAHIVHNHALKQTRDNTKYTLLTILAVLLTREPDVGVLGKLTTITLLNQYSREYEEEADLTATNLLIKAGYNPVGFLTFLERLHTREMFKPEVNLGIFQTHPDTENRITYVRNKLIEKGIDIDRRATTDYLKVSSKYILKDSFYTGIICIDDIPVLNLTFPKREEIYLKIIETSQNLDRFLSIDLSPYEINILVEGTTSTLLIRYNKIISLDNSDTIYLRKTAEEVLHETKDKITQVLWEFRLNMPFDIKR
ncbi:MAG: M48 family metalloprotease [Candidatus Atribacteria bacterium]|nr:M48 family metalloprotease [bacterium]MCG2761680.1 M48 family metalloprotease [Candidatus Atribacteria bacterium]